MSASLQHPLTYVHSICFKYFLTWSSSTKGISFLLQPFPVVSRIWDSWRLVLLVDYGIQYFSLFHVLSNKVSHLTDINGPTFSFVFLLSPLYLWKSFLLSLTSLNIFNHISALTFLTSSLEAQTTFLIPHRPSFSSPVCLQFVFQLG